MSEYMKMYLCEARQMIPSIDLFLCYEKSYFGKISNSHTNSNFYNIASEREINVD